MNSNHSKKRQRAESEFAGVQYVAGRKVADAAHAGTIDEKTARLKSARLARDAADHEAPPSTRSSNKGQR